MGRIIFVVGTGTGVGKTAVTALLLEHCLRNNIPAHAIKPFCTGERSEAALLWDLQQRKITISEINPYYFDKPVAPWTAARLEGRNVSFEEALEFIFCAASKSGLLLVEGAGGLLSPLGEKFSSAELIVKTGGEVILVGPNRLGVLNETLLSVEVLKNRGVQKIKVALVEHGPVDISHKTNLQDLSELLAGVEIVTIPFLENYVPQADFIKKSGPQLDSVLRKLV
jgi:dethiobiotin synthetase